jgi:hypothetical protein
MSKVTVVLVLAVAACSTEPAEPKFIGHASKGATIERMKLDGAECRNQASSAAGTGRYVVYREAYTDCMIGKGYEPEAGRW